MEPYAHLKKDFVNNNNNSNKSPKANEELHYMCTILDPQPGDMNGNSSNDIRRSSLESTELENYEKVRLRTSKVSLLGKEAALIRLNSFDLCKFLNVFSRIVFLTF